MSGSERDGEWTAFRARLSELERQIEARLEPDARQTRQILQQRARQMATPEQREEEAEPLALLVFELGGETYALEPHAVDEVVPLRHLTPIPGTPAFIAGVIAVRGHLLSVVDLRRFFELPLRALSERNSVILLSSSKMEFGLLCDRLIGTRTLPRSAVLPPPAHLAARQGEHLLGVTAEHWALLDAAALLNDPRLIVNDPA